jgi:predicted nucleic acid-binding protein
MNQEWVLDPSVLIRAFVNGTDTPRVRTILAGLAQDPPVQLHTVEFCLVECANVLWKYVRFQGMPTPYAQDSVKKMSALKLAVYPAREFLPRALEIGIQHQLAIYDSIYIALAETLGYPFITGDNKQAMVAQARHNP